MHVVEDDKYGGLSRVITHTVILITLVLFRRSRKACLSLGEVPHQHLGQVHLSVALGVWCGITSSRVVGIHGKVGPVAVHRSCGERERRDGHSADDVIAELSIQILVARLNRECQTCRPFSSWCLCNSFLWGPDAPGTSCVVLWSV